MICSTITSIKLKLDGISRKPTIAARWTHVVLQPLEDLASEIIEI